MNSNRKQWFAALSLTAAVLASPGLAWGETAAAVPAPVLRDGQHDFDFGVGTFKTHIRRLVHPLSGSTTWVDVYGTVTVSKVWGGKAQLEELEAEGPNGHFEGMTLRLYGPDAHQWNLYWANSDDGIVGTPVIGEFKDGVGYFYGQDSYNGRTILVRNVYSGISEDAYHFEQAFSDDGGKTWEPNFTAQLARLSHAEGPAAAPTGDLGPGQHDFDWQLGSWKIHMDRMLKPLTGSTDWTGLDGTVVVRKMWGGRANLAEIETQGSSGRLQFLALRLYNPKAKQWYLSFAHSDSGMLGAPMTGSFKNGRGEFYDQSPLRGRAILERFVFDDITSGSGRDEQAFSADGGKTWEVNWVNTSTRTGG